jgi:magnesium-transporting ATPase (P-type)
MGRGMARYIFAITISMFGYKVLHQGTCFQEKPLLEQIRHFLILVKVILAAALVGIVYVLEKIHFGASPGKIKQYLQVAFLPSVMFVRETRIVLFYGRISVE